MNKAIHSAVLLVPLWGVASGFAGNNTLPTDGDVYFTGRASGSADTLIYRLNLTTRQTYSYAPANASGISAMTLGSDGLLYAATTYTTMETVQVAIGTDEFGDPIFESQQANVQHNLINAYDMKASGGPATVSSFAINNAPTDGSGVRAMAFDATGKLTLQYGTPGVRTAASLYSVTVDTATSANLTALNASQLRSGAMALGHDSNFYMAGDTTPGTYNPNGNALSTYNPATDTSSLFAAWVYADDIRGMAVSPRGNLYMMTGFDSGNTGLLTRWNGSSILAHDATVDYAGGLAMDADHNLVYSLNDGSAGRHLRVITPKGALVTDVTGQFDSISNLTAAPLPAAAPMGPIPATVLVQPGTAVPGVAGKTIGSAHYPSVSGNDGTGPVVFGWGNGLDGIARVNRDGTGLATLAYTGKTVPGTTTTYTYIANPSANKNGDATFMTYASANHQYILRSDFGQPTKTILAAGDTVTVPGASGSWRIGSLHNPMINDNGQVAVATHFEKNVNGSWGTSGAGIHRIGSSGAKTLIAYTRWAGQGQTAGGSQLTGGPSTDYLSGIITNPVKINSSGNVAFAGTVTIGGSPYSAAVFSNGGGTVQPLLRVGQTVSGGLTVSALKQLGSGNVPLAINEIDQVALPATLSDGSTGVYRAEPMGVTRIVQSGMPAPDYNSPTGVNGTFANNFDADYAMPVYLNDKGVVLFPAEGIIGTRGGKDVDDKGLFVGNGTQIAQIVREGQALGNGDIFHFGSSRPAGSINSLGHVAFTGQIEDDEGVLTNALFLSTGKMLTTLARAGQTLNGTPISSFSATTFPGLVSSSTNISLSSDDRVTFMAGGTLCITDAAAAAGATQSNPVLPGIQTHTGAQTIFGFTNAHSGAWIDPPMTDSFVYTMSGNSLFTSIAGFPTGFTNLQVWANGNLLGTFNAGDTFTFDNGGLSSFEIRGITPLIDTANSNAFPLQLTFDTPTANFTMSTVPEPTSLCLLATLSMMLRRQRRDIAPQENKVDQESNSGRNKRTRID